MNIRKTSLALALCASIVLAAVPALAGTWDVAADFDKVNPTHETGWSFGYVDNAVITGYSITAPSESVNNYLGDANGFSWALMGTGTKSNYGDIFAIGLYEGTGIGWANIPAAPEPNGQVYITTARGTQKMAAIRWTAEVAGTYDFSGNMTKVNGSTAWYYAVKVGADGSYTQLNTPSPGQPYMTWIEPTVDLSRTIELAAGDSIDFLVQGDINGREFIQFNMTVTGGDPVPEPGGMLALATGLISLGGFAMRRRK